MESKKEIYDEIADKAIDLINDNYALKEIYQGHGFKDWEHVPEEIQNFSLVVLSDEDLKQIQRAFPNMIIGGGFSNDALEDFRKR